MNNVKKGSFRSKIKQLLEIKDLKYDTYQLKGTLYCYDIADTDTFKGTIEIENFLDTKYALYRE